MTSIFDMKDKLKKACLKTKRLQVLGNSLTLIVPMSWIKAVDWNKYTDFQMEFNPNEKTIIITEKKEVTLENITNGKETDKLITI